GLVPSENRAGISVTFALPWRSTSQSIARNAWQYVAGAPSWFVALTHAGLLASSASGGNSAIGVGDPTTVRTTWSRDSAYGRYRRRSSTRILTQSAWPSRIHC